MDRSEKDQEKPASSNQVYPVPPPKDNLAHVTGGEMYPILGGYTYTLPSPFAAPFSPFNRALKNTPQSSSYNRIIPFDYSTDRFVFGAVEDKIFKKRYDRKTLRSKMLREFENFENKKNGGSNGGSSTGEGNPSKSYNICFLILLIFLAVFLLIMLILVLILWTSVKANWYWWLLVVVIVIALAFLACCLVRAAHIKHASQRMEVLEFVAGDVNRKYLQGIGSKVVVGDEGAWLGVEMDPRRTKIEGAIEKDKGETSKYSDLEQDHERSSLYKDK